MRAVLALMYTLSRRGAGSSREKFSDQVKRKCFRAPSRKTSLVAVARFSARSEVLVTTTKIFNAEPALMQTLFEVVPISPDLLHKAGMVSRCGAISFKKEMESVGTNRPT